MDCESVSLLYSRCGLFRWIEEEEDKIVIWHCGSSSRKDLSLTTTGTSTVTGDNTAYEHM